MKLLLDPIIVLGLCLTFLRNSLSSTEQEKLERNLNGGERQIVVQIKGNKKNRANFINSYRSQTKDVIEINTNNIIGMTVYDKETVKQLQNDPNVLQFDYSHKVSKFEIIKEKSKEMRSLQAEQMPWGVETVLQDVDFWKSIENNAIQPIKLCVADTGYAMVHPDLPKEPDVTGTNNYNEPWDEDLDIDTHGTHVAGTIAALSNSIGVTSVIPSNKKGKFQLVIGKALDRDGSGSDIGVMRAVEDCVSKGATVISMSLGCDTCYSQIEADFYKTLYEQGILIIAAAGNSGDASLGYPASYPHVVSVSSLTQSQQRSSFANRNAQVEISGPGSGVLSTVYLRNGIRLYDTYSGTSMATPHVSAVAALVWMYFPQCSNQQIRNVLMYTSKDVHRVGCDEETGSGLVQALDAYQFLSENSADCGDEVINGAISAIGGCGQLKPPCTNFGDIICEDNDACTIDICSAISGECEFELIACSDCGKSTLRVEILTDEYPGEISWQVRNTQNEVVASDQVRSNAFSLYYGTGCVAPESSYTFTIFDDYGDGICCFYGEGNYAVYVNDVLVGSGDGQYFFSESFSFEVKSNGDGTSEKKKKKKKKKSKKKKKKKKKTSRSLEINFNK